MASPERIEFLQQKFTKIIKEMREIIKIQKKFKGPISPILIKRGNELKRQLAEIDRELILTQGTILRDIFIRDPPPRTREIPRKFVRGLERKQQLEEVRRSPRMQEFLARVRRPGQKIQGRTPTRPGIPAEFRIPRFPIPQTTFIPRRTPTPRRTPKRTPTKRTPTFRVPLPRPRGSTTVA